MPEWEEILTGAGWAQINQGMFSNIWRHPSASIGVSATVKNDLLQVPGPVGPFTEPGGVYTRFQAIAIINHGGDEQAARRALREAGYHPPSEPPGLRLRRLTDIDVPPPTRWIGPGWIPRREITVLVGGEGDGKSLFWVLVVAAVTTGSPYKHLNIPARQPADVVIIITEDSTAEVQARLKAAGADLARIHIYCTDDDGSGTPTFGEGLNGDMLLLHAYLETAPEPPAMIVVDAWLDTVAGGLNIRDTQQARAALHPWKQLADAHDAAVILVTHTNRMDTSNTRDLMGGTAALRQKARMVLFTARANHDREEDEQHMWIGPDKANTTGLSHALKFTVAVMQVRPRTDDDPGTVARLQEPMQTLATIRTHLEQWRDEQREANQPSSRAVLAQRAIQEYMQARKAASVPVADLKDHLKELGYSKNARDTAVKAAGESRPPAPGEPWVFSLHGAEPASLPASLPGLDVSLGSQGDREDREDSNTS
ncbi:AAA family ATPase [Paeniglutamicibacter sp.]|uniref:AAA family ATPase n=1 Tax=Paeniglutamicibacter sp. TaxID=1934391 RepID=UPI003989F5EC